MDGRVKAAGLGEGDHVVAGAGELEDSLADPLFQGCTSGPGAFLLIEVGGKHRELTDDKEVEMEATHFLPSDKIQREAIQVREKARLQRLWNCLTCEKEGGGIKNGRVWNKSRDHCPSVGGAGHILESNEWSCRFAFRCFDDF